ncbi:MAG: hypothetical protein K1X88_02500 [Nannocystaceae bacterium]|nr:hypothetical protein [Nannocystaceae bacterium]
MTLDDTRRTLAGLYLLKKLDLEPADGGLQFPLVLPRELEPIEPVLEQLVIDGLLAMDRKKGQYRLTPAGVDAIGNHIDEAEHYVEEFDGMPVETLVPELLRRRLDPLRVRFLWGWYQNEFDDLLLWQQRRGLAEIEHDWADYLVGDAFWSELLSELQA